MSQPKVSKMRPAELRRLAAATRDAERERKLLAMAEELERTAGAKPEHKAEPHPAP